MIRPIKVLVFCSVVALTLALFLLGAFSQRPTEKEVLVFVGRPEVGHDVHPKSEEPEEGHSSFRVLSFRGQGFPFTSGLWLSH